MYEDKYYAKLVDNDSYLLWALRYIHRNPIRAGICTGLEKYRWASHFFYKNAINNSFINTNFILSIFSKNKYISIKQYFDLINLKGDDNDKKNDFKLFEEKFTCSTTKKSEYIENAFRRNENTK